MAKAKILIVEDEISIRTYLQKCLERAGHDVVGVASTAEGAVAEAERATPDLVLMDIGLQGEIDGVEAARRIRFQLNIPVVYLTGAADEKTLERAKVTEPLGYLLKPFKKQELLTTMATALYQGIVKISCRLDARSRVSLSSGRRPGDNGAPVIR